MEQAQQLQTDAEKEADQAMTQLEDFITEQEKLVSWTLYDQINQKVSQSFILYLFTPM